MASERPKTSRTPRAAIAARFLLRSLRLRGSSFLLALLAVTVGAAMTAAMVGIRADIGAKMSRELRRYGPNLLVTPESDGEPVPFAGAAAIDVAAVARAAGDPSSHVICPMLIVMGAVSPGAAQNPPKPEEAQTPPPPATAGSAIASYSSGAVPAPLVGADFEALRRMYASWRVEGAWPSAGEDACLVGASLAARARLKTGDSVRIRVSSAARASESEVRLTVRGIVSTGESADEQLFAPIALLREAAGAPAESLSLIALAIDGGTASVERAASRIRAETGARARPLRALAAAQGAILAKLERMMLLLTALVLSLSGLCLVTTLMASVVERESEIGLMRSIGAGDGEIVAMFLGEVGLLGLAGGFAGVAVGAIAARAAGARLLGAAIELRPSVIPVVLGISLLLCVASVLVPLRHALAVQPAAALRGD